jgi:SEFIR domain
MKQPPRVFISYSHGSPEHNQAVLDLASQLRSDGIDAFVDRYIEAPVEGWPRWMNNQLEEAEFVLCFCSLEYRTSFEGKNIDGIGLGVNAEGFFIMQDLYDNSERNEKYIPVVLKTHQYEKVVPGALRSFKRYFFPDEYEDLYRRITNQPRHVAPGLGELKMFPSQKESALPIRSNGFTEQAAITQLIKPENYSLEKLTAGDGIFLSRIINPQSRLDHDVVTTVWIACKGNLQYVIDNIRIKDLARYGLGPVPIVSVLPDAEYKFNYTEGSDRVHALVPALSIGPETRNYTSFNISTAPEGAFYHLGSLRIVLGYHASDGRIGTFELSDPNVLGRQLADMLGDKVCVIDDEGDFGNETIAQVVTPGGLQYGFEPRDPPPLYYAPLKIPAWNDYALPNRKALLAARNKINDILARRKALHNVMAERNRESIVADWLHEKNITAADLLGGIGSRESTDIICDLLKQEPMNKYSLHALRVRHLVKGDDLLAEYVIANKQAFLDNVSELNSVKSVITVRPDLRWLWILHLKEPRKFLFNESPMMHLLKDDFQNEMPDKILYSDDGPLEAEVFVRGTMNDWQTPPPQTDRFQYKGNGIYEAILELEPKKYEFKIGEPSWDRSRNFGAMEEGQSIVLNQPYHMWRHYLSKNMGLDLTGHINRGVIFTLDANDLDSVMLTVNPRD